MRLEHKSPQLSETGKVNGADIRCVYSLVDTTSKYSLAVAWVEVSVTKGAIKEYLKSATPYLKFSSIT